MQNNWWKGVFKLGMQSLALRRGSGGQCLLFEEVCLGGEIISWAALELCYCDGVLPHLKSVPIFRELQLLGKGTGEAKVSTWQRSWASVLHALAWPETPSKVRTGVQEPAEEVSGHWHSQQGRAEHRNDSLGSCWVPKGDPDLLAFPVPPSTRQGRSDPSPKFKLHTSDTEWARQELQGAEQVMSPIKFQGDSLVWCHVPARSRKDKCVTAWTQQCSGSRSWHTSALGGLSSCCCCSFFSFEQPILEIQRHLPQFSQSELECIEYKNES